MTKSITRLLVVALLVGSLVGCSTINSFQTTGTIPKPYAGSSDIGGSIVSTVRAKDGLEALGKLFLPVLVVDFALSAAADTVLLPVTLTRSVFFADASQQVPQTDSR